MAVCGRLTAWARPLPGQVAVHSGAKDHCDHTTENPFTLAARQGVAGKKDD